MVCLSREFTDTGIRVPGQPLVCAEGGPALLRAAKCEPDPKVDSLEMVTYGRFCKNKTRSITVRDSQSPSRQVAFGAGACARVTFTERLKCAKAAIAATAVGTAGIEPRRPFD
jgi:hypothetical protein